MDVALSSWRGATPGLTRGSLEARTGSAALHRQGCVLRGSRSLAPQDEGLGGRSGMEVALYGRIKSPHAEVRGRRPSLEARTGSRALHRQGCVLRGSRSLAPQDEGLGGWSG